MDVLTSLQEDFKLFLQALWDQLDLPQPTRAQYAIADYLQHGPKRLQIQAFRGVGKSWITGAFVLWTLFKNPEKKIMIISASKERADNMSIFFTKTYHRNTMAKASTTQIGRFSLESHQFRRKLLTSPSTKRKVGGNNWTANRKPSRSYDLRRHRGAGKFYDGVNA